MPCSESIQCDLVQFLCGFGPYNKTKYYSINVSNVIEEIVKDEEKIYHLNFSELISDKKINLEYSDFTEYDLGAHILDEPHANIFIDKILNLLR